MKKIFLVVIALMMFNCFTGCEKRSRVVESYHAVIGLEDYDTYEKITKQLGDPISLKKDPTANGKVVVELFYDGFSVGMKANSTDAPEHEWRYFFIKVIDSSFKFGKNIHVGATRKTIIKEYRNAIAIKEYDKGCAYYDSSSTGHRWVEFEYDENDTVCSIIYYS